VTLTLTSEQAVSILKQAEGLKRALERLPDWAEEAIADIYDVKAAERHLGESLEPLKAIEQTLRAEKLRQAVWIETVRGPELVDPDGWLDALEAFVEKPANGAIAGGDRWRGSFVALYGSYAVCPRGVPTFGRLERYGYHHDPERIFDILEGIDKPARPHAGRTPWTTFFDAVEDDRDPPVVRLALSDAPGAPSITVNAALVRKALFGIVTGDPIERVGVSFDSIVGDGFLPRAVRFETRRGCAWVMNYRAADKPRHVVLEVDPS
jgi:hypothetical protein